MRKSIFISGIASAALVASLAMAEAQTKAGEMKGGPAPAAAPAGEAGHVAPQGGTHAPAAAKEAPPARAAAEPNASGANNQRSDKQTLGQNAEPNRRGGEQDSMHASEKNGMRPDDQNGMRNGMNEQKGEPNGRSVAKQDATISPEERTKVRSEFSQAGIKEAPNLNVDVHVGGVAPRTITEYWEPVPTEIISIVPAWSAYRVVRVGDEILIIDPVSFEIVDVLS
jgi:hypothetical protein